MHPEHQTIEALDVEASRLGWRLLRCLSAVGLLSLLVGSGYLLMLWEPHRLPVRVVTVEGPVEHLQPERLQQTVIAHLDGGILTQDLSELKAAVEAMPWVRSASLRRHWPDRLELAVVEQEAVARWGEDALVCTDGVLFRPQAGDIPRGLAKLAGRDEDALRLVARLQAWEPLLQTIALEIEELGLDSRGAWTLRLREGITVALGKTRIEERLARFMTAYPTLAATGMPSLVDLRYSNGLAIRRPPDTLALGAL